MKVFIAVSCLLAVASAGFVGVGHTAYSYPHLAYAQHVPVIGPNGVPLDEPAVAHAKAEHAVAHVEAAVRNGDVHVAGLTYAGHVAGPVAYAAHYDGHYAGVQHLPVIGANGVPVDEPAVAHARAHHAAAHVEAKVRNGDVAVVSHVAPYAYAAHVAAPVAHSVPLDTPEVAHAKAAHFAAHAEASTRNGAYHYAPLVHYRKRRGIYGYAAPVVAYGTHYAGAEHVPVIGANGVPVDTPAVAHAKAEHAVAHVEAAVRNGDVHVAGPVATYAHVGPVAYAGHVAAPFAYAAHYAGHYAGPQHLPVIGHNGVPVDEPAVQSARAHHAAAYVEAQVRNGDAAIVSHYAHAAPVAHYAAHIAAPIAHDVPSDTIEVAAAKVAHFNAHVEAKARNGDLHHVVAPVVQVW